jgi:hypothetical protein
MTLAHYIFPESFGTSFQAELPRRRRAPNPGAREFAVSLQAYIDKLNDRFFVWSHRDLRWTRRGKTGSINKNFDMDIFPWVFRSGIERISFPSTALSAKATVFPHSFICQCHPDNVLARCECRCGKLGNDVVAAIRTRRSTRKCIYWSLCMLLRKGTSPEVWKDVTTLLRYEKLGWKCDNNPKGQEEPSPITGQTKGEQIIFPILPNSRES